MSDYIDPSTVKPLNPSTLSPELRLSTLESFDPVSSYVSRERGLTTPVSNQWESLPTEPTEYELTKKYASTIQDPDDKQQTDEFLYQIDALSNSTGIDPNEAYRAWPTMANQYYGEDREKYTSYAKEMTKYGAMLNDLGVAYHNYMHNPTEENKKYVEDLETKLPSIEELEELLPPGYFREFHKMTGEVAQQIGMQAPGLAYGAIAGGTVGATFAALVATGFFANPLVAGIAVGGYAVTAAAASAIGFQTAQQVRMNKVMAGLNFREFIKSDFPEGLSPEENERAMIMAKRYSTVGAGIDTLVETLDFNIGQKYILKPFAKQMWYRAIYGTARETAEMLAGKTAKQTFFNLMRRFIVGGVAEGFEEETQNLNDHMFNSLMGKIYTNRILTDDDITRRLELNGERNPSAARIQEVRDGIINETAIPNGNELAREAAYTFAISALTSGAFSTLGFIGDTYNTYSETRRLVDDVIWDKAQDAYKHATLSDFILDVMQDERVSGIGSLTERRTRRYYETHEDELVRKSIRQNLLMMRPELQKQFDSLDEQYVELFYSSQIQTDAITSAVNTRQKQLAEEIKNIGIDITRRDEIKSLATEHKALLEEYNRIKAGRDLTLRDRAKEILEKKRDLAKALEDEVEAIRLNRTKNTEQLKIGATVQELAELKAVTEIYHIDEDKIFEEYRATVRKYEAANLEHEENVAKEVKKVEENRTAETKQKIKSQAGQTVKGPPDLATFLRKKYPADYKSIKKYVDKEREMLHRSLEENKLLLGQIEKNLPHYKPGSREYEMLKSMHDEIDEKLGDMSQDSGLYDLPDDIYTYHRNAANEIQKRIDDIQDQLTTLTSGKKRKVKKDGKTVFTKEIEKDLMQELKSAQAALRLELNHGDDFSHFVYRFSRDAQIFDIRRRTYENLINRYNILYAYMEQQNVINSAKIGQDVYDAITKIYKDAVEDYPQILEKLLALYAAKNNIEEDKIYETYEDISAADDMLYGAEMQESEREILREQNEEIKKYLDELMYKEDALLKEKEEFLTKQREILDTITEETTEEQTETEEEPTEEDLRSEKITKITNKISEIGGQLYRNKKQTETNRQQISELRSRKLELNKEIRTALDELKPKKLDRKTVAAEIKKIKTRISHDSSLAGKLDTLRVRIDDVVGEGEGYKDLIERQNNILSDDAKSLQREIKSIQAQLDERIVELHKINKQYGEEKLVEKEGSLVPRNIDIKRQGLKDLIKEYRTEIDELRKELEEVGGEDKKKLDTFNKERGHLVVKYRKLQEELKDFQQLDEQFKGRSVEEIHQIIDKRVTDSNRQLKELQDSLDTEKNNKDVLAASQKSLKIGGDLKLRSERIAELGIQVDNEIKELAKDPANKDKIIELVERKKNLRRLWLEAKEREAKTKPITKSASSALLSKHEKQIAILRLKKELGRVSETLTEAESKAAELTKEKQDLNKQKLYNERLKHYSYSYEAENKSNTVNEIEDTISNAEIAMGSLEEKIKEYEAVIAEHPPKSKAKVVKEAQLQIGKLQNEILRLQGVIDYHRKLYNEVIETVEIKEPVVEETAQPTVGEKFSDMTEEELDEMWEDSEVSDLQKLRDGEDLIENQIASYFEADEDDIDESIDAMNNQEIQKEAIEIHEEYGMSPADVEYIQTGINPKNETTQEEEIALELDEKIAEITKKIEELTKQMQENERIIERNEGKLQSGNDGTAKIINAAKLIKGDTKMTLEGLLEFIKENGDVLDNSKLTDEQKRRYSEMAAKISTSNKHAIRMMSQLGKAKKAIMKKVMDYVEVLNKSIHKDIGDMDADYAELIEILQMSVDKNGMRNIDYSRLQEILAEGKFEYLDAKQLERILFHEPLNTFAQTKENNIFNAHQDALLNGMENQDIEIQKFYTDEQPIDMDSATLINLDKLVDVYEIVHMLRYRGKQEYQDRLFKEDMEIKALSRLVQETMALKEDAKDPGKLKNMQSAFRQKFWMPELLVDMLDGRANFQGVFHDFFIRQFLKNRDVMYTDIQKRWDTFAKIRDTYDINLEAAMEEITVGEQTFTKQQVMMIYLALEKDRLPDTDPLNILENDKEYVDDPVARADYRRNELRKKYAEASIEKAAEKNWYTAKELLLHNNGIDDIMAAELIKKLKDSDPKLIRLADHIFEDFNRNRNRLNKAMNNFENVRLHQMSTILPVIDEERMKTVELETWGQVYFGATRKPGRTTGLDQVKASGTGTKSTQARKYKLDLLDIYFDTVPRQEHYIHNTEMLKKWNALLNDQNMRETVTKKFGKAYYDSLRNFYDFVRKPDFMAENDEGSKIIRKFTQNMATTHLAFNLSIGNKQTVSSLWYMKYGGIDNWFKAAGEAIAKTIKGENFIEYMEEQNPLFKKRTSEFASYKMSRKWKHKKFIADDQTMKHLSTAHIGFMDRITVAIGENAVMRKAIKQGAEDTVLEAQLITERTQPGGSKALLPEAYRSTSFEASIVKMNFLMFTQQAIKNYNMMVGTAATELKNGQVWDAIQTETVILLSGMALRLMSGGLDDDPEEWLKELWRYPISLIPIVGKIASALLGGRTMIDGPLTDYFRQGFNMSTMYENEDVFWDSMWKAVSYTTGFGYYTQGKKVMRFIETGDPVELLYRREKNG